MTLKIAHPALEIPFGDVVQHSAFGPRFSSADYDDEGNIATLRTTDIEDDGRIDYDAMPRASLDESRFVQHFLQPGDLVVTRSGTCGVAAVFDGHELPVLPGAFLLRFRLNERANSRYIAYYFNSSAGRQHILSVAQGAVQQNLSITNVEALRLRLPSIDVQGAIVSALRSYDDLIDNNRRRIKLLEDSVRLLFDEWFVRRRFCDTALAPQGHGLPTGWSRQQLGQLTTKIGSGATPRGGDASYVQDGIALIRSQNVYDYNFVEDGLAHINEDQAALLSGVSVEAEDVLLNITGGQSHDAAWCRAA